MIRVLYPLLLLVLYISVVFPFSSYMTNKPYVEKLGYVPKGEVLEYLVADQKESVAALLVLKVLVYFGTLVDKSLNKLDLPPDYPAMSRVLHAAAKLDPYNMDAYYFAEATLVWDAGQIQLANNLLEHGMRYRNWDYYLPFFIGFNYAYFLKDYEKAAQFYKRAGELTGNELFINLAGRYLYESGRSEMAIAYLSTMEKSARNSAIRKTFQIRLQALKEARRIELARDRYVKETGHHPATVAELFEKGYLKKMPVDPYGGEYYLNSDGSVKSTSKFAFGTREKSGQ